MECLRIVAMLMIVAFHMVYFGGFRYPIDHVSVPRMWVQLLLMGGKLGVNLFVMLSGYYLIAGTRGLSLVRVLKIWNALFFYAVVMLAVSLGKGDFSLRSLGWLAPCSMRVWWFASAYMGLYLVHPFVNELLRQLSRRRYIALLLLQALLWSIVPLYARGGFALADVSEFIFFYSLAAYIRLHGGEQPLRWRSCAALLLSGFAVTFGGSLILAAMPSASLRSLSWCFLAQTAPGMVLLSLGVFLIFARRPFPQSRMVNLVASASFGVYLIHDNSVTKPLLWSRWFHAANYQDSLWLIPYSLMVPVIVYAGCMFIEWLRQRAVERWLLRALRPLCERGEALLRRALTWAERRLQV